MNHEPYEEWLLSGEDLSADQQLLLENHLASCADCTQLAAAWQAVHQALISIPEVEPEPGFTDRWKERLADRRAAQHIRLTWIALLVCVGGILLTLIGLAMPDIQGIPSPIQLLSLIVFNTAQSIVTLQHVGAWVISFLSGVPLIFPVLFWIATSTALLLWSLVWMIGIWRLPHLQRSQNEIHH
jgi:anti-sigma factor RsiW